MLGWGIVRHNITSWVDNSFFPHLYSLDIRGGFFSVVSVATGVPGSDATGTPDGYITSSH